MTWIQENERSNLERHLLGLAHRGFRLGLGHLQLIAPGSDHLCPLSLAGLQTYPRLPEKFFADRTSSSLQQAAAYERIDKTTKVLSMFGRLTIAAPILILRSLVH